MTRPDRCPLCGTRVNPAGSRQVNTRVPRQVRLEAKRCEGRGCGATLVRVEAAGLLSRAHTEWISVDAIRKAAGGDP